MRILWCTWKDRAHPLAGGAESFTHAVARALVGDGHEVHIACAGVRGAPDVEVDEGIVLHRRGGPLVGTYRAARHLYERTWRDWDLVVDEINTRPFNAPMWTKGTPVLALCYQLAREVWHEEAPAPLAAIGRWGLEPWWWTRYRDTPVATVSRSSAASLREMGVEEVHVLPQGSDQRTLRREERHPQPTVVFLGRVSSMKRPFDLLDAYARLVRTRSDARLVFMGDGPELRRLRTEAARFPGVEVLGFVSEGRRDLELGRAWALAATSIREGWGLMVSEAAAAGTFSVGYRVPGLVDSVTATGGVICDPNPAALAEALDANLDRLAAGRPSSTGTCPWEQVGRRFGRLAEEVVAREGAAIELRRPSEVLR